MKLNKTLSSWKYSCSWKILEGSDFLIFDVQLKQPSLLYYYNEPGSHACLSVTTGLLILLSPSCYKTPVSHSRFSQMEFPLGCLVSMSSILHLSETHIEQDIDLWNLAKTIIFDWGWKISVYRGIKPQKSFQRLKMLLEQFDWRCSKPTVVVTAGAFDVWCLTLLMAIW